MVGYIMDGRFKNRRRPHSCNLTWLANPDPDPDPDLGRDKDVVGAADGALAVVVLPDELPQQPLALPLQPARAVAVRWMLRIEKMEWRLDRMALPKDKADVPTPNKSTNKQTRTCPRCRTS